jgi:hypothetical protein
MQPLRCLRKALRQTIPADMPLFTRISATDWVEGGWDIDQSVVLARALKSVGVDLVDASSGGIVFGQPIWSSWRGKCYGSRIGPSKPDERSGRNKSGPCSMKERSPDCAPGQTGISYQTWNDANC